MWRERTLEPDIDQIELDELEDDLLRKIEALSGENSTAVRELLDQVDAHPAGFRLFLAKHRGRMVGWTYIYETDGSMQGGWFVTHPNHRRRGVASALHEAVLEYLSEIGRDCIVQTAATPAGEKFLVSTGFNLEEPDGDRYSLSF